MRPTEIRRERLTLLSKAACVVVLNELRAEPERDEFRTVQTKMNAIGDLDQLLGNPSISHDSDQPRSLIEQKIPA
ncbi:hypothetical protein DNK56_09355 [Streptomyces sp. AC1-42W]|nr:hypothetical protein DNK56_09355 [Streptomyces sp. AC1-42W]